MSLTKDQEKFLDVITETLAGYVDGEIAKSRASQLETIADLRDRLSRLEGAQSVQLSVQGKGVEFATSRATVQPVTAQADAELLAEVKALRRTNEVLRDGLSRKDTRIELGDAAISELRSALIAAEQSPARPPKGLAEAIQSDPTSKLTAAKKPIVSLARAVPSAANKNRPGKRAALKTPKRVRVRRRA